MAPKVTVTLGSSRPGGLDISLAGLCAQTFDDFEVVFVDARYHLRHERVLDAVKASGLRQPLFHVPNHRYSPGYWNATCAGYNTGFALADGELVVMLLDYAYVAPDWLEYHVAHAGKLMMGVHRYRELVDPVATDGKALTLFDRDEVSRVPFDIAMSAIEYQRTRIDEVSCFAESFRPEDLARYPIEHVSIPESEKTGESLPYFFSTKNESFPRANIFEVNGMDERYDLGRGPGDPDLGYRLYWSGLTPWVVRECVAECINPRRILPNMNIMIPESGRLPPPYHERMGVEDGNAYYDMVRAEQRKVAPNPIRLEALRERIWDWRDLSQKREACIPQSVIGDEEYFGA